MTNQAFLGEKVGNDNSPEVIEGTFRSRLDKNVSHFRRVDVIAVKNLLSASSLNTATDPGPGTSSKNSVGDSLSWKQIELFVFTAPPVSNITETKSRKRERTCQSSGTWHTTHKAPRNGGERQREDR